MAAGLGKFGLHPWLVQSAKELAITKPTPVQSLVIPQLLQGRNVVASAATGTGKTASFVIPVLNALAQNPYGVFALVIAPTRELAHQIAESFDGLGAGINIRVTTLTGGAEYTAQSHALASRPHIVVATPDRLYLLLEQQQGDVLSNIRYLILDEADRLLDKRIFLDRIAAIIKMLPVNLKGDTSRPAVTPPQVEGATVPPRKRSVIVAPRRPPPQVVLLSATASRCWEAFPVDGVVRKSLDGEKVGAEGLEDADCVGGGSEEVQCEGLPAGVKELVSGGVAWRVCDAAVSDDAAAYADGAMLRDEAFVHVPHVAKTAWLLHLLRMGAGGLTARLKRSKLVAAGKAGGDRGTEGVGVRKGGAPEGEEDGEASGEEGGEDVGGLAAEAAAAVATGLTLVFVASCAQTETMRRAFGSLGVRCGALHGMLSQPQRIRALDALRCGSTPVLFATDVAARGLDIPLLDVVISYDAPCDPATYVHRAGRVARAGRRGVSVCMFTERDRRALKMIEKGCGRKLMRLSTTSYDEDKVVDVLDVVTGAMVKARGEVETGFEVQLERRRAANKVAPRYHARPGGKGSGSGGAGGGEGNAEGGASGGGGSGGGPVEGATQKGRGSAKATAQGVDGAASLPKGRKGGASDGGQRKGGGGGSAALSTEGPLKRGRVSGSKKGAVSGVGGAPKRKAVTA